jgi:dihydroflavonol-4-reductase
MWMGEMALALRSGLGRAPTRELPEFVVRLAARFSDRSLRSIVPGLGRRNRHSTAKAQSLLGRHARPAAETVVDCGRSLIAANAVA